MAQGGVPAYQRALAGEVRDLTLKEIKSILLDKDNETHSKDFRQQVILRLAGNVLPRLTEITGEDGEVLQIVVKPYESKTEDNTTSPISN